MPGRLLGLDYGSKTVGVAVSDPFGYTVRGIEIIRREKENHIRKTLRRIGELIGELEVTEIVLGLPLNMDGSSGERAEKTKQFGEILRERTGLPVRLTDERLTTVEAEEIMQDKGIRREHYDRYVDMYAACVILEDYLNSHGNSALTEEQYGYNQINSR